MHELAITQNMFEIVLKHAEQAQSKKVTKINLAIGEMTGVVAESVQFYLDFLTRGTIAEGASVSLKMVKPKAKCRHCGQEFEISEFDWTCPNCKNGSVEIIAGKELFVESIEVD